MANFKGQALGSFFDAKPRASPTFFYLRSLYELASSPEKVKGGMGQEVNGGGGEGEITPTKNPTGFAPDRQTARRKTRRSDFSWGGGGVQSEGSLDTHRNRGWSPSWRPIPAAAATTGSSSNASRGQRERGWEGERPGGVAAERDWLPGRESGGEGAGSASGGGSDYPSHCSNKLAEAGTEIESRTTSVRNAHARARAYTHTNTETHTHTHTSSSPLLSSGLAIQQAVAPELICSCSSLCG